MLAATAALAFDSPQYLTKTLFCYQAICEEDHLAMQSGSMPTSSVSEVEGLVGTSNLLQEHVGLNFRSQNGGNPYREPSCNLNHSVRTLTIAIYGRSLCISWAEGSSNGLSRCCINSSWNDSAALGMVPTNPWALANRSNRVN